MAFRFFSQNRYDVAQEEPETQRSWQIHLNWILLSLRKKFRTQKRKINKAQGGRGGMGPWAFGVPLVSTLGLLLNGYILLVVFGLGKQVNNNVISIILAMLVKFFSILFCFCFHIFFHCIFNANQDIGIQSNATYRE